VDESWLFNAAEEAPDSSEPNELLRRLGVEDDNLFFNAADEASGSEEPNELPFNCLTSVLNPSRTLLWRSSFFLVRWIIVRRSFIDAVGFSIVRALRKISTYSGASGSSRAKRGLRFGLRFRCSRPTPVRNVAEYSSFVGLNIEALRSVSSRFVVHGTALSEFRAFLPM